jgi:hypothetical protein
MTAPRFISAGVSGGASAVESTAARGTRHDFRDTDDTETRHGDILTIQKLPTVWLRRQRRLVWLI